MKNFACTGTAGNSIPRDYGLKSYQWEFNPFKLDSNSNFLSIESAKN
ncbi:hypothetical protein PL9214290833 [Planktothrix tepida PCC 9214]|uniref:Uncharacterized protein n=1 Tax=Planktothrix tepida PCC 9214 TaxID=671072 RepID=A0A1J1LGU4_9CYAN|nr:hypothetical protein PL9214290833 [Planktothrix tepida PCC 9214]